MIELWKHEQLLSNEPNDIIKYNFFFWSECNLCQFQVEFRQPIKYTWVENSKTSFTLTRLIFQTSNECNKLYQILVSRSVASSVATNLEININSQTKSVSIYYLRLDIPNIFSTWSRPNKSQRVPKVCFWYEKFDMFRYWAMH